MKTRRNKATGKPSLSPIAELRFPGEANLDRAAQYLDGNEKLSAIFPARSNQDTTPFVPEPKLLDAALLALFISEDDPDHAIRLFVTRYPIVKWALPGLMLERVGGAWTAYPDICPAGRAWKYDCFFFVEPWVKALHTLVERELLPLFQFIGSTEKPGSRRFVDGKIVAEAQTRTLYFRRGGSEKFFSSANDVAEWKIASSWESWERNELPWPKRAAEVTCTAHPVNGKKLTELAAALGLPQKKRRHPRPKVPPRKRMVEVTRAASPDSIPQTPTKETERNMELMLLRDWKIEDEEVFSCGGSPELDFNTNAAILETFPSVNNRPKSVDILARGLWWWRSAFDDLAPTIAPELAVKRWPHEKRSLFRDNWERSAFIYEFRARYECRNRWDFFGKPWVKLNNSQRGVLDCLWPVERSGAHRIVRKQHAIVTEWINKAAQEHHKTTGKRVKSKIRLHCVVDSDMPDADVVKLVLALLNENRTKLEIPKPGRGSGKPRPKPWNMIEALDVQNFKLQTLNDSQRGSLSHAIKLYEEQCKKVEIAP